MSTENQDTTQAQTTEAPPIVTEPAAETPPEQATVERDVESDTLEIPDANEPDGKVTYVRGSALAGARQELKELKARLTEANDGSAKAQQLESQIAELNSHVQQLSAKASAYDAAVAAQQQHRPDDRPTPEDDAEAVELATALDLYTPEGKPDVSKARKTLALMDKRAHAYAQQAITPLAQHTVTQQSMVMLARAKATAAPNGAKPDPAVLETVWSRLDPSLTATPDGAKQAWAVALGYTSMVAQQGDKQAPQRGTDGKFAKADVPPPLYTEKAGGKDTPHVELSAEEKKYAKAVGMTEAEYIASAKSAPWLNR